MTAEDLSGIYTKQTFADVQKKRGERGRGEGRGTGGERCCSFFTKDKTERLNLQYLLTINKHYK